MPRRLRIVGKPITIGKGVRKGRSKYSGYRKVPKNIRSYVKRAIHNNLENKVYISYGNNLAVNTITGSTPNAIYCLPNIGQGTGQGLRIGNEIKIRSAVIKGHVNLLPYNATTNPLTTPVMVKMWLCSAKNLNTPNALSLPITNFFEGGSSSIGFQANMLDMDLTVNKDYWTVYRTKKFELGATYASTGGQVGTGGYFDNSKMLIPFSFRFSKYYKSVLKFNDQDTNYPTNRNLWLITQAVYADGSSTSITPCELNYALRIEFEDA